jgi:hypothetical protein
MILQALVGSFHPQGEKNLQEQIILRRFIAHAYLCLNRTPPTSALAAGISLG